MRIVVRICAGALQRHGNSQVVVLTKRVGTLTVNVICERNACVEDNAKRLLDEFDERVVRRLHHMCVGAGGCTELVIEDNRICCRTPVDTLPGISSFVQVFRERGVEIIDERGGIIECGVLSEGKKLQDVVEEMYNAFLVLSSVYDTQRRIAESVAKSISVVTPRRGAGR